MPSPTHEENRFEAFRLRHTSNGKPLSLREMARLLQVGKSTVSRLCCGETSPGVITARRAELEPGLRAFLSTRQLSIEGINQELAQLFDQEEPMLIQRCELSRAACRWFGLKKDPFALDPEVEADYVNTPELEKVFDRIEAAIDKRRFVAVVGPVGCGKTALRHRVMQQLQSQTHIRMIWVESADFEELRFSDLVSLILYSLGEQPRLLRVARGIQLTEKLRNLNKSGARVVLAIDEAHRLNDKALSALKLFWEKGEVAQEGYNRFLGVLLFAQPQLQRRLLDDHRFDEVVQRLQIERMPSFAPVLRKNQPPQASAAQRSYLTQRLAGAGGTLETLFDDGAINEIAAKAQTPLQLGNLANKALLAAYEVKQKRVEAGMLEMDSNEPRIFGVRRA